MSYELCVVASYYYDCCAAGLVFEEALGCVGGYVYVSSYCYGVGYYEAAAAYLFGVGLAWEILLLDMTDFAGLGFSSWFYRRVISSFI